jgi:hypothetical protein
MSEREAKAHRELAESAATLCAAWAKREGILERVTEEQFTDIAKGFMAGFGLGVQVGCGDDPAGE